MVLLVEKVIIIVLVVAVVIVGVVIVVAELNARLCKNNFTVILSHSNH